MRHLSLYIVVLVVLAGIVSAGCMGAPADKTVVKFISRCETGDWGGAEMMLSNTGLLGFQQTKSLENTFWPVVGMAGKVGIDPETLKTNLNQGIQVISSQAETTRAEVRIKIINSVLTGGKAESIKNTAGLDSVDIIVKFDLVQEQNRWKIDRITPQYTNDVEKAKWEALAAKGPGALGNV